MIDRTQTGLRGRDVVISTAPYLHNGEEFVFHEVPGILDVGAVGLMVSDAPDEEGNVLVLFGEAYVYHLSTDCLTVVPKHVPNVLVPIPPEVCANVVYLFDGRGHPPGSFFRKLAHAIIGADPHNRKRIALGFPEWVRAVNIAQHVPNGLDLLMAANKKQEPLA